MPLEKIQTPNAEDFLPPEAAILLEPNPNFRRTSGDKHDDDILNLAANIHYLSKDLLKYKKAVSVGPSVGVWPMHTQGEPYTVIRAFNEEGETELRVDPRRIPRSERVLTATIKKPGSAKREPIGIDGVPAAHWIGLGEAAENMRAYKHSVGGRGSRMGRLLRGLSRGPAA